MPSTLINLLKKGGIGVIPTDTIYGVVVRALDKKAVKKLYALRRKTPEKPFIVLISSITELAGFAITPTPAVSRFLKTVWPGKVSVIFPCKAKKFSYLHLGTNTLAFRLPKSKKLQTLLKKTGPLLAPSANPEGEKPAETIAEAKKYFGEKIDVYVSAGRLRGKPSTLVSFLGDSPKVLRAGAVKIKIEI
ncbi:MAG: threonylcarbamoyl-AMP synthase [Candidatus Taylorbacteria bacterium]|nr:threonylcarbamoyl-AMP synthase [Candidatus Taylorbacteria bacterium]